MGCWLLAVPVAAVIRRCGTVPQPGRLTIIIYWPHASHPSASVLFLGLLPFLPLE